VNIRKIDPANLRDARHYVQFPDELYCQCPQWVPMPLGEKLAQLDRSRAFFLHSDADFFVAEVGDRLVGRICVMENRRYNAYHQARHAFFYLFDCVEDLVVARGLFEVAIEWARVRGLNRLVGPKGFVPFEGMGMLYRGFEHRPALGVPYNYEYYNSFMEELGFKKEIDFTSFYFDISNLEVPERIVRIARRVRERRNLRVKTFSSHYQMRRWIPALLETYNKVFVENWEYVPIIPEEAEEIARRIISVMRPGHIKLVLNRENEVVGFLLTLLDISAALQQTRGKRFPFGWIKMFIELRSTRWINVNGMGILEEYCGRGGNAILYCELEQTIRQGSFEHADFVQIADTARYMLADMTNLGAKPYKIHRVYQKAI